ncbi:hypothetical protein CRYUN_Cryun39dG0036900 [Craigia yunnanensis]
MAQNVNLSRTIEHSVSRKIDPNSNFIDVNYVDEALLTWKGKKQNIPPSLSELTFLGSLDLSHNYLSGKIPTGSQLQLFDPSTFSHNHGLCGPPVTPNCSESVEKPKGQPARDQDDFDEFRKWFYAGMGLGFAVGFWGFCGPVLFKRAWRHSYFRFLDNVKDWLYLAFLLHKARLKRRIKA